MCSRLSKKEELGDQLKFNSQFESGNLRKAIQVNATFSEIIVNLKVERMEGRLYYDLN